MRSGSAVSVRCSVPELNSSVASQTPRTIVATQPDSHVTVRGTETYLIGVRRLDDQQHDADDQRHRGEQRPPVQRGVGR